MNRMVLDYETRDEGDDDPIVEATRAVEELRAANEAAATAAEEERTRHAEETRALNTRLQAVETRLNRPNVQRNQQDENSAEHRAFDTYMRRGREGLGAEETRALTVSDSQAGGYLAPEQFETEILKEMVEVSPVRQAATVRPTSRASVVQPKRTARPAAKWVGEIEERPETEPRYGQIEIPVHEMACWIDVSNQLLEDSAVNLQSELSGDIAEEFGRLEGEAFVLGDGVKKPVGIMTDPSVVAVPNGHATNLSPDALITLMYSIKAMYRNRGAWLMTGSSIAAIRKLKDGQGNFLWQPSYQVGQPETLLGRPVIEAPDMSEIEGGSEPIAYGDIGASYRIYDRVGMSLLRDPFTQAINGITRFHARRRVGASIVRPDAIRKLKMTAS